MTTSYGLHKNRELSRRNQRALGASVLQSFCRTTSYGVLFGQMERLVQEYFDTNLDSWGVGSINGSPALVLDFQNVDFAKTEMPATGNSSSFDFQ